MVIDNSVVNETFLGHLRNAVADVTVTVTHTKELLENEKNECPWISSNDDL